MVELGLKESSQDFTENCAISFSFHLHLVLHTCVKTYHFTVEGANFWELNTPCIPCYLLPAIQTTISDVFFHSILYFFSLRFFPFFCILVFQKEKKFKTKL
jgi:hypothetical protein